MIEQYTEQARRTIFYARYVANESGAKTIEPEHLLLGLIREDRTFLARFLPKDVIAEAIRSQVEEEIGIKKGLFKDVESPLSNSAKKVLTHAREESDALSQGPVGLEHLLLGLLRQEGTVATNVLRRNGVGVDAVRRDVS